LSCGMPQPVQPAENYFSVLDAPVRFGQDRSELEKRFYAVSRALHPDRFSTANMEARTQSISRMSFLNQAYSVLKNPVVLRDYLLKQEGVSVSGKAAMPAELAEGWFEIQDLLMEDPELAGQKLLEFETALKHQKESTENQIQSFEKEYDLHPERSVLEKLAREIQVQSYLNSIHRDVERIKKNAHSN
jgi:molecular chaperone HscB